MASKKQSLNLTSSLKSFYGKAGTKSFLSSVISIVLGLLVGFVVMLILSIVNKNNTWTDAFKGLWLLVQGPFGNMANPAKQVGNTIFYAVPLIFTGLSVAIAQKTGLFNIGAAGQFSMATVGCLLVGLSINTNGNRVLGILVWILAILAGTVLAAIWGMIPGFFKAFFGVNEVIICIMTNWIAANITTWVFTGRAALINSGSGKSGYLITTLQSGNWTPTLGLNKLLNGSYLDIGIVIAIAVAILLQIMMNKTTFGYQLKACGANKNAAKYAGMNEKRNIMLSMAIAGGLAGLGACLYYLNPGIEFKFSSAYQVLPAYGFNGIPAALLASNNMIGVIFSSLFIRHLSAGGTLLMALRFNQYIADLIVAIIIYLAGFSRLFRDLLGKKIVTKDSGRPEVEVKKAKGGAK